MMISIPQASQYFVLLTNVSIFKYLDFILLKFVQKMLLTLVSIGGVSSSLQGIRIIQAAAGAGRSILISDTGKVYASGKDSFGEAEYGAQGTKVVMRPQMVESLKDAFIVQAAIGNFFTAVLSREGRVYTFSWGNDTKLGHQTEPNDVEPYPLLGPLENIPVVQIAAGYCYLLALTCQPSGM
jgi:alpha-tubulin suppressor-like RCC1 family protein